MIKTWLGGRDSNPDTQIQSLSAPPDSKENQQDDSANAGKARQNPQHSRNKKRPQVPSDVGAENSKRQPH